MELVNIDDFKRAIGYVDGQDFTEEMINIFVEMLPGLNSDLAMQIVNQFPALKEYGINSLEDMEKDYESTIKSSDEGQKNIHHAFMDIRKIYEGELKRDDLPIEERKHLWNLVMETGEKEAEENTEHKKFLFGIFNRHNANKLAFLVAAVFITSVAQRSVEKHDEDKDKNK